VARRPGKKRRTISNLPNKILAVAAKCRLFEESSDEFMSPNDVNIFLTKGTTATQLTLSDLTWVAVALAGWLAGVPERFHGHFGEFRINRVSSGKPRLRKIFRLRKIVCSLGDRETTRHY
jgi:hypothetical protein